MAVVQAASHAGDGGVGVVAQELCRGQDRGGTGDCSQLLLSQFLV